MTQRLNSTKRRNFDRSVDSASASMSSTSSGSGGRNFLSSMSLVFNMDFQYEQLQLMKDKLLSPNGDVYATFMAEKLKKSFGLRALPSLSESQPIITFESDCDQEVTFTLVYYNSQETSPLNYVLKHYFGSEFITLMNEVYSLLYQNTLNTSDAGSETSEGVNGFNGDVEDDIDDLEPEFGEEENEEFLRGNEEEISNHDSIPPEDLNMEDDEMSALQRESIDGNSHENVSTGSISNFITENHATLAATAIVKNPQVVDPPRLGSSSNGKSDSSYSIKYCDTNKLVLNKKDIQNSSTVLDDFNSLPGRGLREHLLFQNSSGQGKRTYTPNPSRLGPSSSLDRSVDELHDCPRIDISPPSLMIDDRADPDWSPIKRTKALARRSSDHLRTALMAVRNSSESDHIPSKKWVCNFKNCGKTFSVRSHLDTHKVTHTGEKRYICNICGGRFTQSSSLRNHRIAIHTKEYPHNCTICKKGFLLPSQLKKHKINYHSSKKHMNTSSASSHANALAAKILATAKATPIVPPLPTLRRNGIEPDPEN